MEAEPRTSRTVQATAHSDFGYPIGGRGPLALPRRLLGRLLWPQVREQIEFNRAVVEVLNNVNESLNLLNDLTKSFERAIDNFENAFDNVDDAIIDADRRDRLMGERLDLVIRQSFIRYHEGVGALQRELAAMSQRLERAFDESERSSRDAQRELKATVRNIGTGLSEVRSRVGQVDLFLTEVKRSLPESPTPERLAALPGALANLYPSFEEVMRGSEVVVKERAREYLADVAEVDRNHPVLDLGCGRGEWLELLRDSRIDAYGIDVNEQYVKEGRAKGLDVRHADALEHLKGLPEFSLSAITAIHLVEHLDTETLLEVLDLALRALQRGGLLILETPNPENLIVGASSFYLDPTHVHPLPPALLSFLVNARGFDEVVVRELKREEQFDPEIPAEAPWAEDVAKVWTFLKERVNGPEDYAVLARRV